MDLIRKHLLREGPIEKEHLSEIIREVTQFLSKLILIYKLTPIFFVLEKEPNVIRMKEPVIIVGDIHG